MNQKHHPQNWYFVKRGLIQHIFCRRILSYFRSGGLGRHNQKLTDLSKVIITMCRSQLRLCSRGVKLQPSPEHCVCVAFGTVSVDCEPQTEVECAQSSCMAFQSEQQSHLAVSISEVNSKHFETYLIRFLSNSRSRNEDELKLVKKKKKPHDSVFCRIIWALNIVLRLLHCFRLEKNSMVDQVLNKLLTCLKMHYSLKD